MLQYKCLDKRVHKNTSYLSYIRKIFTDLIKYRQNQI